MEQNRINELKKLADRYFKMATSHFDINSNLDPNLLDAIRKKTNLGEAEVTGFENRKMKFGTFENREYVVMMTDIRRSTQIIHQKNGEINMFIIFYVYAGIVANIVDFYNGISTEYLGDGVLNIFDTTAGKELAIQKSISAGRDILIAREVIMNPLFRESYLPMIDLGIGIAVGKTIVTRFGYSGATDLKAFGKCTYQVTRLCKGVNEIHTTDLISFINAVDSHGRQFYTNTVFIPGINGLFYKINYYNERYY